MPLPFNPILGNTFNPITLNPTSWYKAGVSPMTFGTGSKISQWNDISGNANHLLNSTSSSQPSYIATGFNGGYPGIQFNTAGNSVLATSAGINMNSSTACTAFIVASLTDAPSVSGVIFETTFGINSGTLTAFNLSYSPTYPGALDANTYSMGTTNISVDATAIVFSSAAYQANISYNIGVGNTTRGTIRQNGTTLSTLHTSFGTPVIGTFNNGVLWVGNRTADPYSFDGYISELIIFNYALTAAQIVQVENYLSNAWGVPNNSQQYTTDGYGLVHLVGGSGASDLAIYRGDLGLTYGTDGYINWADQSLNANTFAQATATLQPVQSYTINSQACMSFSGSTAMSAPIYYPIAGVAKGIMLVYKLTTVPTSGTGVDVALNLKNASSTFSAIYFFNNYSAFSNISYCFDVATSTVFSGINPTIDTNVHTLIIQYNGGTNSSSSSYTTYFDGVLTAQGAGTGSTTSTAGNLCSVGGILSSSNSMSNATHIDIAELHAFTGTLTPQQIAAIQSYWTTRYGDA